MIIVTTVKALEQSRVSTATEKDLAARAGLHAPGVTAGGYSPATTAMERGRPMAKLEAMTTTTEDVRLDTRVAKALKQKLLAYQVLKDEIKAKEEAAKKLAGEIDTIRDDVGVVTLSFLGFKITMIAGTYRRFNMKRYVALGGDPEIYRQANEEKPRRSYTRISLPGESNEDTEE